MGAIALKLWLLEMCELDSSRLDRKAFPKIPQINSYGQHQFTLNIPFVFRKVTQGLVAFDEHDASMPHFDVLYKRC